MLITRVELGRFVSLIGILALAGCGTIPSLDMSDGAIDPPGQQVGIVIGSVLVQTDEEPPDSWFYRLFGRKTAGFDYDFEIVRAIDTTNPQPTDNERYKLEVKPAVERIFVARLPFGRYVINGFRYKGLSVLAAELGLNFVVAPRTTLYIGRLIVKVPPRVSVGTPYEVEIQNAKEPTVAALQTQHPGLGRDALDGLIQGR